MPAVCGMVSDPGLSFLSCGAGYQSRYLAGKPLGGRLMNKSPEESVPPRCTLFCRG